MTADVHAEVTAAGRRSASRVCIAVPTFRRPESLERLLGGLAFLVLPDSCDVDVVVLDNDAEGSARAVVARTRGSFPFSLRYEWVAEPGLASVRNAALTAGGHYEFLAMIDDDEFPHPVWLSELFRVQAETEADAVFGPVPQLPPPAAPAWISEGRFLELPAFPDGAAVRDGWSGNCLLRMSSVRRLDVRFDRTFDFAGGEDLKFFREFRALGGKLAYARFAVALEAAGRARYTAAYILRLNFRRGNTLALCDRLLGACRTALLSRAAKALGLLVFGCATLLPRSLAGGRSGALRAACNVARGAGALAGLFGYRYLAYDRPERPR